MSIEVNKLTFLVSLIIYYYIFIYIRISNRLGRVKTKKPENTEKELKKIIPKEFWLKLNRLFVKFGQDICVPINPKHDICPIENICPKDFSMEEERKERRRKK